MFDQMQKWQKIREEIVYKGWREIIHKYFILPNGKEGRFDIIGNRPFVTIAAMTKQNQMILVKQFRPGPEEFLYSFPEGYIDEGEAPEESARRELLEETGYQAKQVEFLKRNRSAYSTETRYCILATGCHLVGQQQLDPNEFIEVELFDLDRFRSFLTDPNAPIFTTIGAAYLALEKLNLL